MVRGWDYHTPSPMTHHNGRNEDKMEGSHNDITRMLDKQHIKSYNSENL